MRGHENSLHDEAVVGSSGGGDPALLSDVFGAEVSSRRP